MTHNATTTAAPGRDETVAHVLDLGDDLIRALAPSHGSGDDLDRVLRSWHHIYGSRALGLICAAALRTVFADCLTPIRPEDAEPGAIGLIHSERTPL